MPKILGIKTVIQYLLKPSGLTLQFPVASVSSVGIITWQEQDSSFIKRHKVTGEKAQNPLLFSFNCGNSLPLRWNSAYKNGSIRED
jgi:hypothetical protein